MNSPISHDSTQEALEAVIRPSRLFAVGEQKRSGLILCKAHYAEFAGPGAAIGSSAEPGYSSILAIGSPEIIEVVTHEERQKAYGRRIQWVRWLNRIVSEPEASQRAEKLLTGFEEFFGPEILASIPDGVLALLAGVLPYTIANLRSPISSVGPEPPESTKVSILVLDGSALQESHPAPPITIRRSPFPETLNQLPCSA